MSHTTPIFAVCPNCFDVGRCFGNVIKNIITNTDCECQDTCAATPGCTNFTFDYDTRICTMMGSCTSLSDCSSCSSGPSVCSSTTTTTTTSSSRSGTAENKANSLQWHMSHTVTHTTYFCSLSQLFRCWKMYRKCHRQYYNFYGLRVSR